MGGMEVTGALPHLVAVLASRAERSADKPALCFLGNGRVIDESVSFAELHAQAQVLAASLQRRCAGGARVMLMLPNQIDYVRAFCACLYAGLIAVPLFPPVSGRQSHLERVRNVVADAQPALILCEADNRDALRAWTAEIGIDCRVATVAEIQAEAADAWQCPRLSGDDVAFLQYTSGSTGTPKGVMVRHRNLLANLLAMQQAMGLTEQDRVVSWLPLFHDMGLIGAVLEALYSGMTLYLMTPQAFVGAPATWLLALSQYRATVSYAPNAAFALCNRIANEALLVKLDLGHWALAVNGAEPIHPGTMAEFCRRFAPAGFRPSALTFAYGQAEATLGVSIPRRGDLPLTVRVDRTAIERGKVVMAGEGDADAMELAACGHPVPDHEVVIVDPHTKTRCADDEVGEIWLAGPSNADAYWRNPEASAETLRARLPGDDTAYLRSGDLGFFHAGQLVICGRLKDLIILNGHNVYPHDIEFAITDAVPSIRAGRIAAFSVLDEEAGREKLVVVAEHRRRIEGGEAALYARMRQAVRDAADCAVDSIALIAVGSIPITTSGKISRQGAKKQFLDGSLQVFARSDAVSGPEDRPGHGPEPGLDHEPLTPDALRTRIARGEPAPAVCLAYLQDRIRHLRPGAAGDAGTPLVALGLDSMTMAALRVTLERELGWSPSIADLFGAEHLADLAARTAAAIEQARPNASTATSMITPTAAPLSPDQHTGPLSHAQQRLWFLHALQPESCQHNIVMRMTLRGRLDGQALQRAMSALIERHAILRTRYRNGPDGAEQVVEEVEVEEVIDTTLAFQLRQHDLSALAPEARRRHSEDLVSEERRTPFDLENGPVLRGRLLTCGNDEHALVLCLHHIAFDGRSAEIFLDELGRAYEAYSRGQRAALPALPLTYLDLARRERARVDADSAFVREQLAFWRQYVDGMPERVALGSAAVTPDAVIPAVHTFLIEPALCRALAHQAREANLTLFMLLLAGFSVVLHHFGKQERFLVGTDTSGRWQPDSEQLIGFFVNQLAIRCDHTGDPSLRALLARQRQDALDAYAHQELPFDLLVSALAPARTSERAPLFQVKLNYQPGRTEGFCLADARLEHLQVHQERGAFDLVLDLVHGERGITAELAYDRTAQGPLWAVRFQRLWQRLLGELASWLDRPLSALLGQMQQWDAAAERELEQTEAAASRARLGQIKRRPMRI